MNCRLYIYFGTNITPTMAFTMIKFCLHLINIEYHENYTNLLNRMQLQAQYKISLNVKKPHLRYDF